MNRKLLVYNDPYLLAEKLAEWLIREIERTVNANGVFTIALSGGQTPGLLYSVLGDHCSGAVSWDKVHLFWGDERCVDPRENESNYRLAWEALIGKIEIPCENIHRMRGESDPAAEAERYSEELSRYVELRNGIPSFTVMLLGIGEDGHTASLFPGFDNSITPGRNCIVATHPVTGQKRISVTMQVINNSESVVFAVTGAAKAGVVAAIWDGGRAAAAYPAALVRPRSEKLFWYLDKAAASQIGK